MAYFAVVHIVTQGKNVKDTSNSEEPPDPDPKPPAPPAALAAPTFSYSYIPLDYVVNITLNCDTPGTLIHYATENGTTHEASFSTVAAGTTITDNKVPAGGTVIIKAYASASGMPDSATVTEKYTATT